MSDVITSIQNRFKILLQFSCQHDIKLNERYER